MSSKTSFNASLSLSVLDTLGALFLGEHFYVSDIIGSLIILGYNIYDTANPKK